LTSRVWRAVPPIGLPLQQSKGFGDRFHGALLHLISRVPSSGAAGLHLRLTFSVRGRAVGRGVAFVAGLLEF
jgi:hypothetical protein